VELYTPCSIHHKGIVLTLLSSCYPVYPWHQTRITHCTVVIAQTYCRVQSSVASFYHSVFQNWLGASKLFYMHPCQHSKLQECFAMFHKWFWCATVSHKWCACFAVSHKWCACFAVSHKWCACFVVSSKWCGPFAVSHMWCACFTVSHKWRACFAVSHKWRGCFAVSHKWCGCSVVSHQARFDSRALFPVYSELLGTGLSELVWTGFSTPPNYGHISLPSTTPCHFTLKTKDFCQWVLTMIAMKCR
jgi:hypothetical protein